MKLDLLNTSKKIEILSNNFSNVNKYPIINNISPKKSKKSYRNFSSCRQIDKKEEKFNNKITTDYLLFEKNSNKILMNENIIKEKKEDSIDEFSNTDNSIILQSKSHSRKKNKTENLKISNFSCMENKSVLNNSTSKHKKESRKNIVEINKIKNDSKKFEVNYLLILIT